MRILLSTTMFVLLALQATAQALGADAKTQSPNIVFILADDLGYGDTGCFGKERCKIETPNIDALAAGGLRFTDAHVNASVCGPTRLAIMTGRYPWRYGKTRNSGPWGFVGPHLTTESFTLAKMLNSAGYNTGYVGKWHLGTTMTTTDGKTQGPMNVDFTQPLKFGPVQFGFDYSFILPGSLDMYPYVYARNNIWKGEVAAQKGWSAFNRVGPAEKDFQDHEVLETFYTEAETYIAKQKASDPFFLFLALTAPHTPTSPGVNWRGKSKLGVYGDFVMEVDHAVERVVNALKKQGVYENTLILFSSDHGAASYAGNILKATPGQIHLLEKQGHYASGPYRGYKFTVYEGGLRVPLIAHWPNAIKAGSECNQLIGMNDLMATFAELSGGNINAQQAPDSISFAKLLTHPEASGDRTNLIMQSIGPFVVRQGDWKLCLCPHAGSTGKHDNVPNPDDVWQAMLKKFGKKPTWEDLNQAPFVQLFNLAEDVHEDHNLAADHPEKVAKMVALLRKQIHDGRSTPGPKLSNDNEGVGINQRLPGFVKQALNK